MLEPVSMQKCYVKFLKLINLNFVKRQKEIEKLFFELLQVVVWKRDSLSCRPTAKCWQQLFDMATRQSLVGVCFAGVQRLCDSDAEDYYGMSELQYLTWMGMAAKIQQKNHEVDRQCVELQKKFLERGVRSCIIKGQANHEYYGELASLRQSGDIDIWVEGGLKKAVDLVNSFCPTKEIRETHAQLHIYEDTEVEVHYRPGLIRDFRRNAVLQSFFTKCADDCFSHKMKLPCGVIVAPTVYFNAVQQLLHIYHHLFDSGIGLRQVMDYYFVLKHLPEEDKNSVMHVLNSVGVSRFAKALMYVEQYVFGLENCYLLCEPSSKDGEYLLREIMIAGNFGHFDNRQRYDASRSFVESFLGVYFKNFRHARFAPMEWFWSPLWRLYYFGWRKIHGYE